MSVRVRGNSRFPISVENLVAPVSQTVFDYDLFLAPGGGCASCATHHRTTAGAFFGRLSAAHDAADGTAHNGPADRATQSFLVHLLRDLLALRQILLIPPHIYPGGVNNDVRPATGTTGSCEKANEDDAIPDSFHGFLPVAY